MVKIIDKFQGEYIKTMVPKFDIVRALNGKHGVNHVAGETYVGSPILQITPSCLWRNLSGNRAVDRGVRIS